MSSIPSPKDAADKWRKVWEEEQIELKKQWIDHDQLGFVWNSATATSAAPTSAPSSSSTTGKDSATNTTTGTSDALMMGAGSTSSSDTKPLKLVGGVDISFVKGNAEAACAALVVLSYPELQIVHSLFRMVKLKLPYVCEFLAFREVSFLVDLVEECRKDDPDKVPQLVMVDGNGHLHPRGFGLACHLGVLIDIPTIGIGKNFLFMDGMTKKEVLSEVAKECGRIPSGEDGDVISPPADAPDLLLLRGDSGHVWGAAFLPTTATTKPIYVSQGHRISLQTAIDVTRTCCKYRMPEPVRQADLQSRDKLRDPAFVHDDADDDRVGDDDNDVLDV